MFVTCEESRYSCAVAFGIGPEKLRHAADGRARREVLQGGHRSHPGEAPFLDADRLPEDEEILDFTTGDKEFWVINGAHNLCYIHPAKTGIRSNLNLITSSGHVYSFVLNEIANESDAEPDLKVFVEPKEGSGIAGSTAYEGYVRAGEAEAYKKELEAVQPKASEISAPRKHSHRARRPRNSGRITRTSLRFDYALDSKAARETLSGFGDVSRRCLHLYPVRRAGKTDAVRTEGGKPNLINFQLSNGVYIVPKILDAGYLAVGKKKPTFPGTSGNAAVKERRIKT